MKVEGKADQMEEGGELSPRVKRARWTCFTDEDDSRRWVLKGSLAEIRLKAEAEERAGKKSRTNHAPADGDTDYVERVRTAAGNDDAKESNDAHEERKRAAPSGGERASDGKMMRTNRFFDAPEANTEDEDEGADEQCEGVCEGRESGPAFLEPPELALFDHQSPRSEDEDLSTSTSGATVARRRLIQKTSPDAAAVASFQTPATHGDNIEGEAGARLMRWHEAWASKRRIKEKLKMHAKRVKAARTGAWAALHRDPTHLEEVEQEDGDEASKSDGEEWGLHSSHNICKAPGSDILYCAICGSWTSGRRSRGLTKQCRGDTGRKGGTRLLQLGIAPLPSARVPQVQKRLGERGTRGGFSKRGRLGRLSRRLS